MKKTNDYDKPNNNDDELERIFNLSGKNESFESESNNSFKNNKSTVKDFYYESEEEFNEELLLFAPLTCLITKTIIIISVATIKIGYNIFRTEIVVGFPVLTEGSLAVPSLSASLSFSILSKILSPTLLLL